MRILLPLLMASCFAADLPADLLKARDAQDRAALDKIAAAADSEAQAKSNDAAVLYKAAQAQLIRAEVSMELRDKNAARGAAEAGIRVAEKAVALKPNMGEYHRILGTLCGQVIPANVLAGMKYGKCALDEVNKAVELAPKAASGYLSRAVGNYYLPASFGGGPELALKDVDKALELDPKDADAWLWKGIILRKLARNADARKALAKSQELHPERLWTKQQLEKDAREVKQQYPAIAFVLLVLTLLGFFVFPGHTWLQSDTQIYAPMLDRMLDPALVPKDELALRPHVTWTLYDEIAFGLRHLTGADLEQVLGGQQLVFRFIGLAGAFLLAQAMGLGLPAALFAAACFGLGAVINGPAVLTLEYEPVPRAFAILLLMGAFGCAANRYWRVSAVLAFLATIYHPTSTAPFWACAALYFLVSKSRRELWPLAVGCAAAIGTVLLCATLQHGETERQVWFGVIPTQLETVQKFRAMYNWIQFWPSPWFWQYPALLLFSAGAWWRIRTRLSPEARFFSLAVAVYGMLMVPLQYLLLDVGKWILMPQFQPARAVLFITAMALLLGVAAGWHAATAGRRLEAFAWFVVVFAIPTNGLVIQLFTVPDARKLTLVLALAAVAVMAVKWPRTAVLVPAAAIFLIPGFGGVRNYPVLHTAPLRALSAWAHESTPQDAMFLFADVGHGLQPGVFRNDAKRSIYVDWKGGGQANLLEDFARLWWQRWNAVHEAKLPLLPLEDYRAMGVDYIVVRTANRPPAATPVYSNSDWAVLATRPTGQ